MHRNDHDVTGSVRTTDPAAVGGEVLHLYSGLFRGAAPEIERGLHDAEALYQGRHLDYFACDTEYHDIQHVLDVTLAMARLMDGYQRGRRVGEEPLTRELFTVGVLTALFHDFGYLRRRGDRRHRHGAEYTLCHVSRSSAFLRHYLRDCALGERMARLAALLVHFTGYERPVETIAIAGTLPRRLGQMLGSADIIAQMSDRCYLEKCRDRLYPEFVLGRVPGFTSGEELLRRTPLFYRHATRRLDLQLARSYRYAASHFGGPNLYLEAMERNARYAETGLQLRRQPPETLVRS